MLNAALTQVKSVQKWKLAHLQPLDTWVRGAVALMGDACHPTLPYQAQGAAMAVEDGATVACLLDLLVRRTSQNGQSATAVDPNEICETLRLYESIRKQRTELNVRGADMNRIMLHLPSGPEMEERDQLMRDWDWQDLNAKSKWPYFDPTYAKELMGFDAEREATKAFEADFGMSFSY